MTPAAVVLAIVIGGWISLLGGALAGYFSAIAVDWALIVPLAAIAAAATLGGARLASRLPQLMLQRVLAACLVVAGSWAWVGA